MNARRAALLSCGAFGGVLARALLQNWFEKAGALDSGALPASLQSALPSHLAANVVGCFVMGLFVQLHTLKRKAPFVHAALTTGFCGCLTTFSGLNQTTCAILWEPLVRNHSISLLRAIVACAISMMCSWCSLRIGRVCGAALAEFVHHKRNQNQPRELAKVGPPTTTNNSNNTTTTTTATDLQHVAQATPPSTQHTTHVATETSSPHRTSLFRRYHLRTSLCVAICIGLECVLIASAWAAFSHGGSDFWCITLAGMCFAPFGACLRAWLGLKNPTKLGQIPIFTAVANVCACLVLSLIFVLLHHPGKTNRSAIVSVRWAVLLLKSVGSGFCGSLSTVSTFVFECDSLGRGGFAVVATKYVVGTLLVSFVVASCFLLPLFELQK